MTAVKDLNPPELSGTRLQRWVKVSAGIKFFKCDSIYLDGSHEMIADVTELWGKCEKGIAFKKHPIRTCYVAEGEACKRLNKAATEDIDRQINEYISYGLPVQSGMFETGIILRKYNNDVLKFGSLWQSEIDKHTHRDQLSIMKALFDTKIEFSTFEVSDFRKYIKIQNHSK